MFRAELPGTNEKDIELKIEGRVLTLKGERKIKTEKNKSNYHFRESHYGGFSLSVRCRKPLRRTRLKPNTSKAF